MSRNLRHVRLSACDRTRNCIICTYEHGCTIVQCAHTVINVIGLEQSYNANCLSPLLLLLHVYIEIPKFHVLPRI